MTPLGIEVPLAHIRIIEAGATKRDALNALIDAVAAGAGIADRETFARAVFDRETAMSTGIGGGIAIPHVRLRMLKDLTVGVAVAPAGVDYGALDHQAVRVMVLFATPEGADAAYLGLLAKVMLALKNRRFFERLVACRTPEDVYAVLHD